jgi:hypothetical protein
MRHFVVLSALLGMLAMWATIPAAAGPVPAVDSETAISQADHGFTAALNKGDAAAIGALLDPRFEWTDAEGKTRTKAESLEDIRALAADNEGDTEVKILPYSELGIVYGFHHNVRFGRIWVKRPEGWRAMVFLDTPLPKQSSAPAPASTAGGDCDNPCRTLPFKPTTTADKAVLTEWQKTKVDEWHPDADDWATHVADEFLIINDRSERNKVQRVAFGKKLQEAGISMPGDPIKSMQMYDFGDTVLMISHHAPYRGGKPYYNDRVFVHRDGHWLIAWSQQTTDQSAAPLPPVRLGQ